MPTLPELIRDPEVLLALPPEELARSVLIAAVASAQNGMFLQMVVLGHDALHGRGLPGVVVYPEAREHQISEAAREAWHWLELNLLIMPAEGINGHNGHRVLTRRGRALVNNEQHYKAYVAASAFPKAMLHPAIADDVWLDLARNDFAVAVLRSFRAVEEAVREASGYGAEEYGVPLMRHAFHPENGPLTKRDDPVAEREALAHLFVGAIGSYKNPHSHRTVDIAEAREAQEMVTLASHLLRIVDARSLV